MIHQPLIPYLPSIGLYRRWMLRRLEGADDADAWRMILEQAAMMPRDMARTFVAGARGQERLRLSVAVEGGSSVVKRGRAWQWILSDHGRWPLLHLRAMETAYSSTPYYQHYIGPVWEILENVRAGDHFAEITLRLHNCVLEALKVENLLPKLRNDREKIEKFDKIEIKDTDLAIFDVIFRKGPDAIFALLE